MLGVLENPGDFVDLPEFPEVGWTAFSVQFTGTLNSGNIIIAVTNELGSNPTDWIVVGTVGSVPGYFAVGNPVARKVRVAADTGFSGNVAVHAYVATAGV